MAGQIPLDKSHLERLDKGNKSEGNTLKNQPPNCSRSQFKVAINTTLQEEFDSERENIFHGFSRGNREERMMEMNTPHQDPSYFKKSVNSTIVISQY